MLLLVFLSGFFSLTHGCADFLFVLGNIPNHQTRDTAIALVQKLEVASGLHRVAIANVGGSAEMPDFNKIQSKEPLITAIRDAYLASTTPRRDSASYTARELDAFLDSVSRKGAHRRRVATPMVVLLVDEGLANAAPNEVVGQFAALLGKRHYMHFFIVSSKVKKLRDILHLTAMDAGEIVGPSELELGLGEFLKCGKAVKPTEFRRKPIEPSASYRRAGAGSHSGFFYPDNSRGIPDQHKVFATEESCERYSKDTDEQQLRTAVNQHQTDN